MDHRRLKNTLQAQIETAELRQSQIAIGARTATDAVETWLVAEAYKEAPAEEFRQILVNHRLFDLWQLCENEGDVNALGSSQADYWAYKILTHLGCKDVEDVLKLALSLDQYDNVPDETYVTGTPENKIYRRFIEKAFAENSESLESHGMKTSTQSAELDGSTTNVPSE